MNILKVQDYFDTAIPALPFALVGASLLRVDVATINNAKRLASSFVDYVHPDVLRFLDVIAAKDVSEQSQEERAVVKSNGFIRFVFYLTVYCGRLRQMLEAHAAQYLPLIGISVGSVVSTEFYPSMIDKNAEENKFAALFNGDLDSILLYCNNMQDSFVRFNLIDGHIDISAVDILGYVERIS